MDGVAVINPTEAFKAQPLLPCPLCGSANRRRKHMNKAELGRIAARALLDAEGMQYDVKKIGDDATWHEGAAAVYRKAIADAEEVLDSADDNDFWGYYEGKEEFRARVREKLQELLK
jgi:hypothetical protein